MKTIMIIHTENASRRKHFAAAKKYGAKLVLVKRNPHWESEYVDYVIDVDTRSISKTVEAVKKYALTNKIDGVVTFVEHSVPTAAAVATALNLPYISEHTAELARNKYEMRKAFSSSGIPCPNFSLVYSAEEATKIAKEFNYPLVLKPLIGGGSMFIRRVDSDAELEMYFDMIQHGAWDGFEYDPLYESASKDYEGAVLVESYIEGGEVSLESIVINGKTNVIAIHDKPLPMTGPYFEEVYFTTPSRLSTELQERLKYWTCASNEALGINMGATHTEFRITDGEPIILETAARMGGGPVYRTVLTSTGIDMVHAIMNISLGIVPDLTIRGPKATGFRLFFAENEGRISKIEGIDKVSQDSQTVEIEMYKKIGDEVLLPPRIFQAHGHMIVTADTLDNLDQKIDNLTKSVRIEVIND